jgi:transcription antitermination factor NusA-like protein
MATRAEGLGKFIIKCVGCIRTTAGSVGTAGSTNVK